MVDEGAPRAAWIPEIHARQRGHVGRYGADILPGSVARLRKPPGGPIEAEIEDKGGGAREIRARRVLLVGLVRRGPPVKTADVLGAAQVQAALQLTPCFLIVVATAPADRAGSAPRTLGRTVGCRA